MAAEALEELIDLETQQETMAEIREEAQRLRNNARVSEIKGGHQVEKGPSLQH